MMKTSLSTQKSRWLFLGASCAAVLLCALLVLFHFSSSDLTLKQAQQYSLQNSAPLFIHHTRTDRFTPLAQPFTPQSRTASAAALLLESDASASRVQLSAGDELVYLSLSQQAPSSLTLLPISEMGYTFPLLLQTSGSSTSVTELATPTAYFSLPSGSVNTFQAYAKDSPASSALTAANGPLLLDGVPVDDYLQSHAARAVLTTQPYSFYRQASRTATTESILDLSDTLPAPDGLSASRAAGKATLTVGCFSGTVYQSFSLSASCLWLSPDSAHPSACPTTLTQNGYAQISLSGLASPTRCYAVQFSGSTPRYFILEMDT